MRDCSRLNSHVRGLRRVDAGLHGRAQAPVALQGDVEEVLLAAACLPDARQARVAGAVVHEQHASRIQRLREELGQPQLQRGDVVLLILHWHDDRQFVAFPSIPFHIS